VVKDADEHRLSNGGNGDGRCGGHLERKGKEGIAEDAKAWFARCSTAVYLYFAPQPFTQSANILVNFCLVLHSQTTHTRDKNGKEL
jgi:hypothetical protein